MIAYLLSPWHISFLSSFLFFQPCSDAPPPAPPLLPRFYGIFPQPTTSVVDMLLRDVHGHNIITMQLCKKKSQEVDCNLIQFTQGLVHLQSELNP